MKKNLSDNKTIIILLSIFMLLQPFLDVKFLFEDEELMIKGITIPTIVRTLFIGIIGLITFIKGRNKKEKVGIIIYFIILTIYSVIHHIICQGSMDIPDTFTYSIITEAFYMIRMSLPLILIYITKNSKIDKQSFINVLLYSAIIIGFVILISNTFKILYTSYNPEGAHVRASWLSWIFGDISKYKFEELTSKGWFYLANQVAGLSILLLPFCIYDLLKKIRLENVIASTSLTFGMIILGTRTSAYGFLLIYVLLLVSYVLLYKFKFINTINKKSICVVSLILVVFSSLLLVAPIKTREYTKNLKPIIPPPLTEGSDVLYYIKRYYSYYGIQQVYIEKYYPYKKDYTFWLDVFDKSHDKVLDNREIQLLISNRIASKNNDLKYELFGYSYSRMRNGEIYIEKDFYAQKITVGTIGSFILFVPYFILIIKIAINRIKKKRITLGLITFLLSMCAVFGSSLFTGHVLDELFVMLYVGFIIGFYLVGGKYEKD